MAVRVIGANKEVEKEVTCKGCGAVLGYTPNDVKRNDETDYEGGADVVEWIDCPKCSHRVIVYIR